MKGLISGAIARDARRRPIGVFDSGVGGLTVLRELYRQLPNESLLYLADTARLPYGMRSPAEIVQFSREILSWMERQGVKMVVMACNTSSALALDVVRAEFDLPIVGLILPAARVAVDRGSRVGVIATPITAASDAYRRAMVEIDPTVQVWQVGCPEFVPIVEQGRLHEPDTLAIAQQYLEPLLEQSIDTLVYGCTHYPHLAGVIEPLLPPGVVTIDPAVHVVAAATQELELLNLKHLDQPQPTRFCVTGEADRFASLATRWLGCAPLVEQVQLLEAETLGDYLPIESPLSA